MPKSKHRIDKKTALTFRLVSRSQRDPLIADETAPQQVLLQVNKDKDKDPLSKKEKQIKYGVYFDDDYDYLKHLKSPDEWEHEWEMVEKKEKASEHAKMKLPSSLFASIIEEEEGMLNKAAPRKGPQTDWDPDVVAALDDDFDFDDPNNRLDDDFVLQAMAPVVKGQDGECSKYIGEKEDYYEGDDEDENDEDNDDGEDESNKNKNVYHTSYSMDRFKRENFGEDYDKEEEDGDNDKYSDSDSTVKGSEDENELRERLFGKEETKSVFTNYSLTSSIVPRNEGLSFIDERFEAMFEKEYGNDMEVGGLDFDDIEGSLDPNNCQIIKKLIEEDEKMKSQKYPSDKDKMRPRILDEEDSDGEEDEKDIVPIEIDEYGGKNRERMYDCESILSTYSNLYNHPKLIRTERRDPKKLNIDPVTGLVVSQNSGLTKRNLRQFDAMNGDEGFHDVKSAYSRASRVSEPSERPKNETPEERKERKAAFKQYKRERRMEKKANRQAFKMETDKHNKDIVKLKNNMNAMKLV